MANPDQKTILIEEAYQEIKVICTKFQEESGVSDMEVKDIAEIVWEQIKANDAKIQAAKAE